MLPLIVYYIHSRVGLNNGSLFLIVSKKEGPKSGLHNACFFNFIHYHIHSFLAPMTSDNIIRQMIGKPMDLKDI